VSFRLTRAPERFPCTLEYSFSRCSVIKPPAEKKRCLASGPAGRGVTRVHAWSVSRRLTSQARREAGVRYATDRLQPGCFAVRRCRSHGHTSFQSGPTGRLSSCSARQPSHTWSLRETVQVAPRQLPNRCGPLPALSRVAITRMPAPSTAAAIRAPGSCGRSPDDTDLPACRLLRGRCFFSGSTHCSRGWRARPWPGGASAARAASAVADLRRTIVTPA